VNMVLAWGSQIMVAEQLICERWAFGVVRMEYQYGFTIRERGEAGGLQTRLACRPRISSKQDCPDVNAKLQRYRILMAPNETERPPVLSSVAF
jgi:hypothetical protein